MDTKIKIVNSMFRHLKSNGQLHTQKDLATKLGTYPSNISKALKGDVAFALNHASQHRVTERYISIDYSPIDRLNEKVVNYVLNS